ncbi:DUF5309 domain-containing protein [Rhizorhapis sp.]|uniref:DUF5309 domain-containing protein n=1 Tax=Rhizorhapis sp. TaxID=1968842 RepID=UPI002B45D61F|nr:DUF5309 domain-containing protein [Rhizorhapis sp.]HKR17651.1 DUF5309 domain-containing protein [Rhizorhapis sp.]
MALPTNTATTYANVGIREDLSDIIYRVAPEETPFINNIGTGKATNTYHEWQTENLTAAADDNAVLEGDDATLDAANVPARVGNRCQISDKTAVVSGTNDAVNKAGRKTEMARQVMLKGLELARDQEKQMLSNKASVAGAAGTARQSAGIESWITTNASRGAGGSGGGFSGGVVAAPTDGTQRAFTEALLKAAHLLAFNNGGKPNQLYMGGFQKQAFSAFAGVAQQRRDTGDKAAVIIGAADVYVGDFGRLAAIPHPYGVRARTVIGVDPRMAQVDYLRPMRNWELSKSGDTEKRQMLVEYTLKVSNELAHMVVADLTTS